MATIWNNDAFRAFLKDNGFNETQYNDGLKAYLVDLLGAPSSLALNDLLKLFFQTYGSWEIVSLGFTPEDLFAASQVGIWLDMSDISTLFQDSSATTAVTTAGEPIGRASDKSGNNLHMIQATTANKPLYQISPPRAVLDKVNDNLSVTLPSTITGTLLYGTAQGTIHLEMSQGTSWGLTNNATRFPGNNITEVIVRHGVLTAEELSDAKDWLVDRNSPLTYTAPASMANALNGRTDITKAFLNTWNTSAVTSFLSFATGCTNLTALEVSSWNVGNVILFNNFASNCTNLTALDVSLWDTSKVGAFTSFIQNCPNITTLDVSNWNTGAVQTFINFAAGCTSLTSLDISGWSLAANPSFSGFAAGCSSLTTIVVGTAFDTTTNTVYTNAFLGCALNEASVDAILVSINNAGTSNGTLGMSGGTNATPSVGVGQPAATALRGRGWTVTLNGF